MHQADRAIVLQARGRGHFPEHYHICGVQHVETTAVESPERVEDGDDVILDGRPSRLIEASSEAVRPWGVVVWDGFDYSPHLINGKWGCQGIQVKLG